MGNTNRDLLKRLLRLLPVKNIKEEFDIKGSSIDIIENITGNKTDAQIKSAVYRNQRYTRQNIYLYTLDKNFNVNTIGDDFPLKVEIRETNADGELVLFCLPKVTFTVYLSSPTEKEDLKFFQPLTIRVKGKTLIIQYTKLESNVKFYYDEDREAKKNSEKNSEEATLKEIIEYFETFYTVTKTDINKGVKHLWHVDDLDCHKISYRNPHSVTTTVMDGDLTFKTKYPADYQVIIKTAIGMAIWKYLLEDDYLCEGFTADLTNGIISITKFPKLPNQVSNVITKILANN